MAASPVQLDGPNEVDDQGHERLSRCCVGILILGLDPDSKTQYLPGVWSNGSHLRRRELGNDFTIIISQMIILPL